MLEQGSAPKWNNSLNDRNLFFCVIHSPKAEWCLNIFLLYKNNIYKNIFKALLIIWGNKIIAGFYIL